jgi:hypothetical protein
MSSYVFICDHKGDNWSAKRFSKDEDAEPLEAEASSTYELQKKLSDLAKAQGATGGVSLTFSYITQTKALCQVRSVLRRGRIKVVSAHFNRVIVQLAFDIVWCKLPCFSTPFSSNGRTHEIRVCPWILCPSNRRRG